MSVAVEVRGLTKRFGSVVAVDDVSLDVEAGSILALLGPSGCGKTTFLRLIAGFERPDAGAVTLAGVPVCGGGRWVPPERRRAGFVFQDHALFPHLSVARNVAFGLRERDGRDARVAEVLDLVGLSGLASRAPHELSGGQQQRVALARALAPRPAIVLLDEPFSNLDADLRQRVRGEVREILRVAGATAVFVTHDQQEAFEIADRVAVMRDGRVEQHARPEEIYHTPLTRFVADFVGEAEFLPFEMTDGHARSELGAFAVSGLEPGPGEVMVRPEDLRVEAGGDAEVIGARFHGPVRLTVVRLPSGRVITAAHSSQSVFAIGDSVGVRFAPDHIVLFRGERQVASFAVRQHTGTDPAG